MIQRRSVAALVIAAAAAASAGCGSSSSPAAPSPIVATKANVTMTISPSPATAIVCSPKCTTSSGASFDFSLSVTAILKETAGLGASVDGMEWMISRGGASSAPLGINPTQIISTAGTNHLTANSSLSIPIGVAYSNSNGNKDGTVTLVVHMTDDKGNPLTLTGSVIVQ